MERTRPFTWIASAIFAIVALVHIYRLVRPFDVVIGGCHLPLGERHRRDRCGWL